MSSSLRELITSIRKCKSAQDKRAVIAKALANVRNTGNKKRDLEKKYHNVAQLLYCDILGHPVHFAQMQVLSLLASDAYIHKRLAYLALTQLMDENSELLILSTSILLNDIHTQNSKANPQIKALALCAIGCIASPDMSKELGTAVEGLRNHSDAYLRKKAFCAAIRIVKRIDPNNDLFFDAQFFKSAVGVIQDTRSENSVLVSAAQLLYHICSKNPKYSRKLRKYQSFICKKLEYFLNCDIPNSKACVDQFVMVHLLKLLGIVSKGANVEITKDIHSILLQIAKHTNIGTHFNAVLYECVKVIMLCGNEDTKLNSLAIDICVRFIHSKDNNLRYVALRILANAAPNNYESVQQHRHNVFKCLKDTDLTIRKRALDLIYILTNKHNIKSMFRHLLQLLIHLHKRRANINEINSEDIEFIRELASKLHIIVCRYAHNNKWNIDALLQILSATTAIEIGFKCECIMLITNSSAHLQSYFIFLMFDCINKVKIQSDSMRYMCAYLIGEYCDKLLDIQSCKDANDILLKVLKSDQCMKPISGQFFAKSTQEIISTIEYIITHKSSSIVTKAVGLTALQKIKHRLHISNLIQNDENFMSVRHCRLLIIGFLRNMPLWLQRGVNMPQCIAIIICKFYPRFGSPDMSIRIILEQCKHNKHIEIQQRAVDIGSIYENCDKDLRLKVLKPIPAMKLLDLKEMYTMESKDEKEESLSDSSSSEESDMSDEGSDSESYSDSESDSSDVKKEETIGLSKGGAKDVNIFRKCIDRNIMPTLSSITFDGLLYGYYFDTKTVKHTRKQSEISDEGSNLFYPSYCYAKIQKLEFINDKKKEVKKRVNWDPFDTMEMMEQKTTETSKEFEYYMSVGLNSNVKKKEFKRKNLNLILCCDASGSMKKSFNIGSTKQNKMKCTKNAMVSILNQLTMDDRVGIVTFNSDTQIVQKLKRKSNISMERIQRKISNIKPEKGTDFEKGFTVSVSLFQQLFNGKQCNFEKEVNEFDNRVIILTDAHLTEGRNDSESLLKMIRKCAENEHKIKIYSTFIGIGLDFNTNLIETISQIRGCNYFSASSANEFNQMMKEEWSLMVTPLLFNIVLRLKCEGNSCEIDKVYGSDTSGIESNGEITRIHTLFPSKKSKKKNKKRESKGGIQLIRLKKHVSNEWDWNTTDNDSMNVELEVTFEDRFGKKYKNVQFVTFDCDENKENNNFYDNMSVRKGILLCKYVELMHEWIKTCNSNNSNKIQLRITEYYKNIFIKFIEHFKLEMMLISDHTLQRECDILQKLIKLRAIDSRIEQTVPKTNELYGSKSWEAYHKNGILTVFNIVSVSKEENGICVVRIAAVFSNDSAGEINNFSFLIAVPKYIKLQIKTANGTVLKALSKNMVTQKFQLTNTMHKIKPFVIRIKMTYLTVNGKQTDTAEVQIPMTYLS